MIRQVPESGRFAVEMRESYMTTKDEAAETLTQLDETGAEDFGWESNRDDENPENLPWPEENESKE